MAKGICEASCGTQTAHMCSKDELLRSVATGTAVPTGWYAGGAGGLANPYGIPYSGGQTGYRTRNDCKGFTSSDQYLSAGVWTGYPNSDYCSNQYAILCCD